MPQQFIGSGWSYPLRTDVTGSIALSSGDRDIVEAIRLILGTSPGERPMRPEFGCRIHDRVFDTADAATAGEIGADVKDSLRRWEPRITVRSVDVTIDEYDRAKLYVDVAYEIRGTNDKKNLVFPFYVIPEHEE
jgi:phage baseplate assembly protein W